MYSDDDMVLKKHDNSSRGDKRIVLFILFHSISGISWVAVVLVKEAHWRFKTVCAVLVLNAKTIFFSSSKIPFLLLFYFLHLRRMVVVNLGNVI